ncbi:unnamed protein product [Prorocentrum cordatum]|uniref:Aminotransferase class V domain-containing protein n=1 Tax=Prorocentrum cordatum TaxID=2364126 RepID=A0ABN9RRP4_9DINO|nr:unnamed protein product [Polarella glacialis]
MGLKQQPWTLRDGCDARVRASFAELVGCAPAEVALWGPDPSTSFAISTAARAVALRTQRDDVGLILEDQMSSNVYPWQQLQQTHGLALEAVPRPADGNWTRALLSRLAALEAAGRRVVVVAVPVYLWTDGSGPVDVAALSEVCRDPGRRTRTVLVVDGTQSLGAVPFDVRRTPVDFLAASVHKWLFGAYGLACMYAAREWQERPRAASAGAGRAPQDPSKWPAETTRFPSTWRCPGTPPRSSRGPAGSTAAAGRTPSCSPWRPTAWRWSSSGGRPGSPPAWRPSRPGSGRGARPGGAPPRATFRRHRARRGRRLRVPRGWVSAWVSEAARFLKQRGVHVSARLKVLRVAPHVYTGPADADRFTDALAAFVRQRRGGRSSRL